MTGLRRQPSLHKAVHEVDAGARQNAARSPVRRSFNESAHKLGYWTPPAVSAHDQESEASRKRFEALDSSWKAIV